MSLGRCETGSRPRGHGPRDGASIAVEGSAACAAPESEAETMELGWRESLDNGEHHARLKKTATPRQPWSCKRFSAKAPPAPVRPPAIP